MMDVEIKQQGAKPQMMIIMDQMFRSEEGASYGEIIDTYCYQRKYDLKTKERLLDGLKNEAYKAKNDLTKRLEEIAIKIIVTKKTNDPEEKDGRRKNSFFKYSDDPGEFDPVSDLRCKLKKMKLCELSELLEQSAGLFPKSWLMNFKTQVDEFNEKLPIEVQMSKVLYFDNNEKLKNIDILPTLVEMIKKKQVIRFLYRPFDEDPYVVTVHPQILKEYNLRWFLFALQKFKTEKGYYYRDQQFALDRIDKKISICDKIHYIKSNTNYDKYFSERVGVSGLKAETIEVEIIVKDKRTLEYIRTKPIHHSQRIKENKIYYQIKDNYEFVTRLFEFADKIFILKPDELRDKILSRANDIININKL